MKKITYIFILLFFICCNKSTTDENKNKVINLNENSLDPAFLNLKSKKYDTVIRKQLKNIAVKFVRNNKNYFEIYKYIDEQSNTINDPFGKIEANTNLGVYYFSKFQNDSAFYHYSKAEKISKNQIGNPFMGSILQSKADLLWCQKNFTEAESTAIKALRIAIKKKNNELILSCYLTIANSLVGLNKDQKALKYYEIVLDKIDYVDTTVNKLLLKALVYNYIAMVYQKKKDYYKSIKIINEALKFDNFKKNNSEIYSYLTNSLAYSKFKLGDKSSLKQFQETLQIGDSIKSIPIQITSKTHLGEYYLAEKDTLKANLYLKAAQLQAHKNNIFEDELKILQLLAKANPIEENFYSNRYIELTDSLQNVERATRDKFARIEFETDEITTQKNSLTLEKEYLSFQRWMIGAISLFSIIIIVLWFKNKSQKAKTRELFLREEQKKAEAEIFQLMIDQQNKIEEGKSAEKQRISLELHDNVMGNLSGIRVVLWGELFHQGLADKEPFVALLDGIQKIEKEVRNIAHNLNTNMFSGNSSFVEVVKELIIKTENHSAVKFEIEASPSVNWDGINNTIKINLYRIIQEAIQNIEKYANAKNVSIAIMQNENILTIEITDDGEGFDTQNPNEGIGIKNMKTRMASLNGKITIESKIKNGTKINLTVSI